MISEVFEKTVKSIPGLDEQGSQIKQAIHGAVLENGEPARNIMDVLHGTWLGHPLHPVLTDLVIGSWVLGALFDGWAASKPSRYAEEVADTLTGIGTTAAIPTAITGLADYSTITKRATGTGLVHGLLNILGLSMYLLSLASRGRGNRGAGVAFSTLGLGLVTLGAWVGGHLTYKQRVGVNHSHPASQPQEWQTVLAETELAEQEPVRIEVAGNPVLLYRYGGTVYAISAVCSHAGGPLEEGQFDGLCVECPWHNSVFDLRDGGIVHGPATIPQPAYSARIFNGHIQLRAGSA